MTERKESDSREKIFRAGMVALLVAGLAVVSCTGGRSGGDEAVSPPEPQEAFYRMIGRLDVSSGDTAAFDTLNRYATSRYDGEYYEAFVYCVYEAYAADPTAMLEWIAGHPDTERLSDWLEAALDMSVPSGERLRADIVRLRDKQARTWLGHRFPAREDETLPE